MNTKHTMRRLKQWIHHSQIKKNYEDVNLNQCDQINAENIIRAENKEYKEETAALKITMLNEI